MSSEQNSPKSGPPKRSRRSMIALASAALIAIGGAFSLNALAGSNTAQHMKVHFSGDGEKGWFGGMRHKAGWGGRRGGRGHNMLDLSDVEIEAKLTRVMKHVAIEIDASEEQQQKIVALLSAAAKDLRPVRDSMRQAAGEIRQLLLADTLDREALEALRASRLAESDRISKTLIKTVGDVAEVLSPAQRKLLNERIEQHRSRRGGWHRG